MRNLSALFRDCADRKSTNNITPELLLYQHKRNREIERELKKDKSRLRQRQMILLLGTGESGKSTFLKQMRLINGKNFTPEEMEQLKSTIYDNIYKGILFLIQARENFGLPWASGDASPAALGARQLEQHFASSRALQQRGPTRNQAAISESEFLSLAPAFGAVWSDENIRKTFERRSKIITEHFSENTRYYLNRLDQIAVENYIPTEEDIVWTRKATECIVEEEFNVRHVPLVFVDVGGQTKERRKWCQCFSDMSSVLFLIACSHFDEHYQDRVTKELRNKLREALTVFGGLINHEAFRRVAVIMFFNKTDILTEKVESRQSNIRDTFPEFPDSMDPYKLNDVKSFIAQTFVSATYTSISKRTMPSFRNEPSPSTPEFKLVDQASKSPTGRTLYKHFTTAVDKRNIQTVFTAIENHVLNMNIRQLELK